MPKINNINDMNKTMFPKDGRLKIILSINLFIPLKKLKFLNTRIN